MLGTMSCIYDMPLNDMQFASTETKKTEENSGKQTRDHGQSWKKTISSTVRNSPNRSRENAKLRIPRRTIIIITPNCQLFGGDIQVEWHTSKKTFWESTWITLCLRQLQGTKTINSYGNNAAYHCAAQKTSFNTSAEALSFLLQLLDRSFLRINASGLPRHCGVTLMAPSGNWVFFRKVATSLTRTMQKKKKYIYIYIFCTGRLPSLKQPNQLPARTLQPRRSGMFFRWAGIQRPDSQKLAIHANRVQELKENNGLIGFYRSGISMNKFW